MKTEHLFTLFLTLALVAFATAVQAATGGAGVGEWAPMTTTINSIQGPPAVAVGSAMVIGSAVMLGMGDMGHGGMMIVKGVGATGLATNATAFLNAVGVTGALS